MLSVIIPTLFCADRLYKTLIELSRTESVGEIILIDNTGNDQLIKLDKLVHLCQKENIYVNAAWNLGVSVSKFDKICLLNDDIWFNWDFFNHINSFIHTEVGFIGMHPDNFQKWEDQDIFYDSGFRLISPTGDGKTKNGHRPINWGSCIFFEKNNWDIIPDNLKIWAGDDWLFYRSKKPNYLIHGLKCFGEESQTIRQSNVDNVIKQDMLNMVEWVKKGELDNYLIGTIWWKQKT